jgi:hypothetical protein
MKYCPKCPPEVNQFQDSVQECPEHHIALVDHIPAPDLNHNVFINNCPATADGQSNYKLTIDFEMTWKPMVAGGLEILGAAFVIFMLTYASITPGAADIWIGGLGFLAMIVFGIIGGISALRRKRYVWALVGGILTSGVLIGIPALVLIMLSRKEFTNLNAVGQIQNESWNGKSKRASVLMAVFLAFFTWLYTYEKDRWKFWAGLGLFILASALAIPAGLSVFNFGSLTPITWIIALGVWIWAIVDVTAKNEPWYKNYSVKD